MCSRPGSQHRWCRTTLALSRLWGGTRDRHCRVHRGAGEGLARAWTPWTCCCLGGPRLPSQDHRLAAAKQGAAQPTLRSRKLGRGAPGTHTSLRVPEQAWLPPTSHKGSWESWGGGQSTEQVGREFLLLSLPAPATGLPPNLLNVLRSAWGVERLQVCSQSELWGELGLCSRGPLGRCCKSPCPLGAAAPRPGPSGHPRPWCLLD